MPRGIMLLVVLLIVLIGALYLFSSSADEVPQRVIESEVASNVAAQ
jgi:hypothetical protein